MFNENVFKERVIELVSKAKHQREGIANILVQEFDLPGKHTVSRKVKLVFGITLAEILKLRFIYDDWLNKLPNIEYTNTSDLYTRTLELRNMSTSFKEAKETLKVEFNLTEMELLRRCRSIFQKTLTELFEPTYEEAENALIRSETSKEFKDLLGLSTTSGVFQKYFNRSNFVTAKANVHSKIKIVGINPNTMDNESIVLSQILGDGSYDKARGAIRISHGIKQLDYLKLKVSLLKNAYPNLADISDIKVYIHAQGHEYCNWYSRRLPDHVTNKIESYSTKEMINSLSPLGWYLWYMDDGNLYNGTTKSLNICGGIELELHELIRDRLLEYTINGNAFSKSYSIQKRVEIVKFLNTFIKPFEKITPKCMEYKTQFMI